MRRANPPSPLRDARPRRLGRGLALTALALIGLTLAARGQGRFFRGVGIDPPAQNAPYDGRFTFVRLRYTTAPGGYWFGGLAAWAHGYPLAERNLMQIMNEVSFLGARTDATNLFGFDDPALAHYPIAYVIEPDWSAVSDGEARALGAYLRKGGFLIVDDFKARGGRDAGSVSSPAFQTFAALMQRVIPGGRLVDVPSTHPIFHAFFEIRSLDDFPQAYINGRPVFRGVFEDNDPRKRLLTIVNYNTDISQFWEWSGRGFRPFDDTNEAYKLGVNYLVYGLTH